MRHAHLLAAGLVIIALLTDTLTAPPGPVPLAGEPQYSTDMVWASTPNEPGQELWQPVAGTLRPARINAKPVIQPRRLAAYTLNRNGMAALLGTASRERTQAARAKPLVLALPNPHGEFQRFTVQEAAVMAPGLAARHPEIKTYRGRGIDDPVATLRFDLTPLGFHASVRSPGGAWYIDPYYHLDQSLYASYYGRDLPPDEDEVFVEREAEAADSDVLHGGRFGGDAPIAISDLQRTLNAQSDTPTRGAHDRNASATPSERVVRNTNLASDPPTGDVLRTYRLALITDPGYATYVGGSANVTAAKVTLINRVSQIYEEDLSIRLELVEDNDLLNLDTWEQALAPNGPCGAAGCFTQAQLTGCTNTTRARFVLGQIIGASDYDIGRLALGQPDGGLANPGVVGRSNKAGGCTSLPTPVGDFFAVDYVAHEMGHQFNANHSFNGNQLKCSGINRNAATSVEPGSGSSIMAYAGNCLTDDLQPHNDPAFSQRSLQEISTYTSSNQPAINEVQTVSLRHFGGGNEVQAVTFGPGYTPVAAIQPLSLAINAAPSTTSRGGAEENGNTVTIATGNEHTLQVGDLVTIAGVGVTEYNGTFTITSVPTTHSFQYTNPISGLQTSGGGTVTLAAPGASEAGTTVTIRTAAAHGRSVGDVVTIAGVGVSGYNGTFTITAVPTSRSFEYTAASSGLANAGGGTMTFFSPFQVQIGGNNSALIGGSGLPYTSANIQSAINAISGFGCLFR